MAKITKEETLTCTAAEADAILRNADGRVRFQMMLKAFMPTAENRGFEGSACISVSKAQARKAVQDMLRGFEDRGARIKLHMSPPTHPGGLSFISIY